MAFFTLKLKSQALASTTTVRLYYPCDLPAEVGNEVKGVITLLHGYTNDGDDWVNMSAALRYAADNGLALIIPDASNSFYMDMAAGPAYYTWLTQEMPALLNKMVKLPQEREKNAICGLSMGGYGALLLGLTQPDRYFACASFSGAVDLAMMLEAAPYNALVRASFGPVLGPDLVLPEDRNLYRLAEKVSQLPAEQQPRILCTAGRQDIEPYYIYNQNLLFKAHAENLPLDYHYMEWDGVHEWNFWDRSLVHAIDLFFNPGYAAKKLGDWSAT